MTQPMANSKRGQEREKTSAELATRPQPPATRAAEAHYDDEAPETTTLISVFGSSARKGEWEPPEVTRVFALFGKANVDFTQALLPPGVSEVQAFCIFGDTSIVVPEGLDVEITGTGVLGDFRQTSSGVSAARRALRRTFRAARGGSDEEEELADDDVPTLRVSGLALFGTVKVVTR